MPLFRSARREPDTSAPAPTPPPAWSAARGDASAVATAAASRAESARPGPRSDVAATLRQIVADAVAPEDALQPALEAVVEAVTASAGAVCLYDSRRELLRLAVETGLSDEGCKRLRNVRRNDPVTWDMPLNALLNRRVYLIDNAAQNRYVPPLLDPATSMRTVVCIPLLTGVNPLGALILIATGTRAIHERSLQGLTDGLRELATLIESVRRQAMGEPPVAAPGPAPSPFVPKTTAAVAPAAVAPQAPPRSVADAQALADRIAAAKLRRQATPPETPPALETQPPPSPTPPAPVPDPGAELDRVRATLILVEAARDAARAEVAKLASDVEDLTSQLASTTAERTRSEQVLRETAERAEAAAEAERVRREELETTFSAQHRASDLQPALDQAWTDLRRAITERDAALAEVDRLRGEVARLEAELATSAAEQQRLLGEGADSRGRADALEHALEAEQARAREVDERARALETELSAAGAERQRLLDEAQSLRSREATNLERIAGFEEQITALQAARSASSTTVAGLEEQIQALEQQCSMLSDQNRALAARLEELLGASLRAAPPCDEPASVPPTAQPEAPAPAGADPDATPPPAASEPGPEPARPSARVVPLRPVRTEAPRDCGTIAVLSASAAWDALGTAACPVVRLAADDDLAARLGELAPGRVLVDLVVPGVLERVAAARAAGSTARFWGCVTAADGKRAIRLGMIEPTPRPLDPDAVLELIAGYAGRGARVFTAGADADALISLRQALSRQGMSVSIAWDGKQATDMLGVVRPEVAVIDLEIPPREGYGLIVQLGTLDPLATIFVIHGSEDTAAGFAAALADRTVASRAVELEALLADVLKRSEGPVAERR